MTIIDILIYIYATGFVLTYGFFLWCATCLIDEIAGQKGIDRYIVGQCMNVLGFIAGLLWFIVIPILCREYKNDSC